MTKKPCNDNCNSCNSEEKEIIDYGFYSNVLKKPFERLVDLRQAEEAYFAEQKAKEDKAAQKKADALKVEDAFKALNAARKAYKEDLTQLTKEYAEELEDIKKAFELGKKDITSKLAEAEDAFNSELKKFSDTYGQYHFSLKGDDFETTISGSTKVDSEAKKYTTPGAFDLFDWFFGF